MKINSPKSSEGFTIVELMIALSVLATILVMSTVIMIQISALYSKGVNAANLQNTSRNAINDIASALQFGGSPPIVASPQAVIFSDNDGSHSVQSGAYCINNVRYTYVLGREQATDINGHSTPHVLYRDTITGTGSCPILDITHDTIAADSADADPAHNGYDMLADHMRLTKLSIAETPPSSGVYNVDVWGAYGDSDLVVTAADGSNTCKGGPGTQFCSTSQLSTSVTRRLQ